MIRTPGPWGSDQRKAGVAIGVFDGVHLGHQQILRQTIADARACGGLAVAVTFDCHPNSIVAPERTPPLIYSLPKKLRMLEASGIDVTRLIHFDQAFSGISAEQFVRDLMVEAGSIASICVGEGFTFGYRRQGNVELLRTMGVAVHAVADVALDGVTVSSTRVRQAIRDGDLEVAGRLLGRRYTLSGNVVRGAQLGRKLGFPTANLDVTGILTPPLGVYAAEAVHGGKTHRAAVNIGHRPTINPQEKKTFVEAHLLDFNGELYDQELELSFLRKLRDEIKFPTLEALKEQVARDIAEARK
ncbi:MAG TPA: bifunctional riboflavin kinase/FAD synthetase [Verrucomicrobiae bacterium]|nr:bifunctional riboflavin kinase/FAD synthetase [Verrucomicrobiae bacterium]